VCSAQVPGPNNAITDVPGITVGHFTGDLTGTTVVRAAATNGQGVAAGVTQRGGSPGTRETDLLKPENMVTIVNAIVLSGGSAYGLAAASGAMICLEQKGVGFGVGGGVVPIVPAVTTYDGARCGAAGPRPGFQAGFDACQAAIGGPVAQGNVGAGAGAVAGAVKGGIGTASIVLENGVIVGAIAAVNSSGAPYDEDGTLWAASLEVGDEFKGTTKKGKAPDWKQVRGLHRSGVNAVVATNVTLTKAEATKIAEMADDGIARAIRPAHSPYDSDTVFAIGTARISIAALGGDTAAVQYQIGAAAADVLARAIAQAVLHAETTTCHPSYCDKFPKACKDVSKK
jgi:L-aminopeptidase/D-esterase-like protein